MSTVLRVRPAVTLDPTLLPRRVTLGLGDLVLAARLAGAVPLPVRTDGGPLTDDRTAERLAGTPEGRAGQLVATELRRADDDGAGGARDRLVELGLLDGDDLDEGLVAALHTLAGGPRSFVLDVSALRRRGEVRLRSWFGVARGLVAQLVLHGPSDLEVAWFHPRLWATQLTRAVTVEPWVAEPAPLALPAYVQLPTELLAGSTRAHHDQRTDLLPAMAAAHLGAVRMGEPGHVRAAHIGEVLALLRTLGDACRGRLRLLTTRRDGEPRPAVSAWLLFDDGWHELRPGRAATSLLRRRDARDLGLVTLPLVEEVQ